MTIRLIGGSRFPVTPGIWVFVTSQWLIVIDHTHVELHADCSEDPGSATGSCNLQKSPIFVTIGIFSIKDLSFVQMSAIDLIIY